MIVSKQMIGMKMKMMTDILLSYTDYKHLTIKELIQNPKHFIAPPNSGYSIFEAPPTFASDRPYFLDASCNVRKS